MLPAPSATPTERLRVLLEQLADAVFLFDAYGICLDVNSVGCVLLGYTRAELIGRNAHTFMADTNSRCLLEQLSSLENTPSLDTMVTMYTKTGQLQAANLRTTRLSDGTIQMVVLRDRPRNLDDPDWLTEAYFRLLTETSIDLISRHSPEGIYLYASPAARTLLGYAPEELLGRSAYEFFHPDDLAAIRRSHTTVVDQPVSYTVEYRIRRKDDSYIWFETTSRSVRDASGTVREIHASSRDITKRKQFEQALRESEERFRLAFSNAAIGMALVDLDGHWRQVNQALCQIVGYSPEELATKTFQDITYPPDLDIDLAYMQQLLSGAIPSYQLEKRYVHKDGHLVWILLSGSMMRTVEGKPDYFISQVQDITARKEAELALRQANQHLALSLALLERRHHEMVILNELAEALQRCRRATDAINITTRVLPRLFPQQSGALYLKKSDNSFRRVGLALGDPAELVSEFTADQCWALRSGKAHHGTSELATSLCAHTQTLYATALHSVCVPLIFHGEIRGLLALQKELVPEFSLLEPEPWHESVIPVAMMVLEHLGATLTQLRLQRMLQQQAIRDPLTGIFNRRYLQETLSRELQRAEREQAEVGVLMIDIDHFKRINDTYGHRFGDQILRMLAQFIQQQVRPSDIVCRYGGEEFTVIMPSTAQAVVLARAEQLCADLSTGLVGVPSITVSIGVASFPQHSRDPDMLLQLADAALYRAKRAGRNQVKLALS